MPFTLVDVTGGLVLTPRQVAAVLRTVAERVVAAEAQIAFVDAAHGAHLAAAELACAVARVPFCPLASAENAAVRGGVMRQFEGRPFIVLDSNSIQADIDAVVAAAPADDDDAAIAEGGGVDFGIDGSALAYYIGTSGSTTGAPRLVECAMPELAHYVDGLAVAARVTSSDRILLLTTPTFDPSIGDIFLAARTGAGQPRSVLSRFFWLEAGLQSLNTLLFTRYACWIMNNGT
jgi:non-ribosomal peptide synthetase component F